MQNTDRNHVYTYYFFTAIAIPSPNGIKHGGNNKG
jgi:hypothetical protein